MTFNMQSHPFDNATYLNQQETGVYFGHTSANYANMIGPFGGVIASTLLRSILEHPDCIGSPVSLTVNYAAPVKDKDFKIIAKPTRTNRSTQHWYVELLQNEQTVISSTAVTALKRNTWSSTELAMPEAPPFKEVTKLPMIDVPPWVQNYDIRIIKGAPRAFTNDSVTDSVTLQWIEDMPKRKLDYLSLTSICDAFFPRIYVRRDPFVPIGTVSLTIYFHIDASTLGKERAQPVLGHSRAINFNEGFYDQTGEIWSSNGVLLATTTQLVYYKA